MGNVALVRVTRKKMLAFDVLTIYSLRKFPLLLILYFLEDHAMCEKRTTVKALERSHPSACS